MQKGEEARETQGLVSSGSRPKGVQALPNPSFREALLLKDENPSRALGAWWLAQRSALLAIPSFREAMLLKARESARGKSMPLQPGARRGSLTLSQSTRDVKR